MSRRWSLFSWRQVAGPARSGLGELVDHINFDHRGHFDIHDPSRHHDHEQADDDLGRDAVRSQYAMLLLMVGLTSLRLAILAG